MHVAKTDWSAILALPNISHVNDVIRVTNGLIICAAGFEDRTLAFSANLELSNCRVALALYQVWADNNRVDEIIESYISAGILRNQIIQMKYDRFEPDIFASELQSWLNGANETEVVVDISTMSRLAVMLVLEACRVCGKLVKIHYAEAEVYGPSQSEYEGAKMGLYPRPSIQVYSGLGGVVRTSRLSSVALQGEPTALIAFMSMNEVLTQALINCICPSKLLLINGRPPHHLWREHATAWIHDELRREWPLGDNPTEAEEGGSIIPTRVTSTLDYTESLIVLLDLYWEFASEFRIVLSPTGSKMQTVACLLVKALHPDIHIEYPTPDSFLKEYSKASEPVGFWTSDV